MKEFNFTAEGAEPRLDKFLREKMPDLSRSHLQKLVETGQVTVNERASKCAYRLKSGDRIALNLPEAKPLAIEPEDIPLDILHEDEDMIIVNKPRGLTVHPAAGVCSGTLVNALLHHAQNLSGINGVIRPGIVHRLDKDTSGVMVVAKNDRAHLNLAEQISRKTARRTYLAIVHGNLTEERGIIKGDIGRSPFDRQKMAVVTKNGKPALTEFTVKERFGDFTLLQCHLHTGRTHQIRVHLAHIGHALAGDPKYGPKKIAFKEFIAGQALHSCELMLKHPATGEALKFMAPLPQDMENILRYLRCR